MNYNGNGTGSLTERAMLVALTVNLWGNRKLDKKVTREVNASYGMGEEIGRYNKWLLIENEKGTPAKEYQAVVSAANAARQAHYEQTLPWEAEGDRILTAANFMDWGATMREHQTLFEQAFETFYEAYPRLVAESERLMSMKGYCEAHGSLFHSQRLFGSNDPCINWKAKSLFNAKNYPHQSDLRSKFGFATKVRPLPSAPDFRVDLPDEYVKHIRYQMESDLQETVVAATQSLMERLYDVAKRVEHLGDPKSVIRKALAGDIRSVCAIAGRLNLNGDGLIEGFRQRIEKELSFSVDTLKAVPEEKEALAARAAAIARDMAAYMSPGE